MYESFRTVALEFSDGCRNRRRIVGGHFYEGQPQNMRRKVVRQLQDSGSGNMTVVDVFIGRL